MQMAACTRSICRLPPHCAPDLRDVALRPWFSLTHSVRGCSRPLSSLAPQASQKAEEQREACRDLIDYREYTVALSAICLRSDERRRLTFIFGLLDEDNSGTLDRDEFAQLLGGVLQSSGLSKAELARQLKADFDAVDVDGSGELDIREFIRAATELPRLQKYFAELSKMATTQQDQAQENEDRMAQKRAATLLQARIRGNRDRRKLQDPEFVKSLHLEERAFTRHIVYSHPVFDTQYELCMPISEKRMLALKKLFAVSAVC
jgi:Ca2+-binding EF-hand superfamily protein